VKLDASDPNWPELLSHPQGGGQEAMPLERHLLTVAVRAREATPEHAETTDARPLCDAAEVVGLVHDFGKATTYFQAHIGRGSDDSGPSHHARLGGLLAYYALSKRGYGPGSCFAGLVAVARHHGTLPNAESFIIDSIEQESTWEHWEANKGAYNGHAVKQAENIEMNHPEFARAVVDRLLGNEGSWSEFRSLLAASYPDASDEGDTSLRDRLRETFMQRDRRWHLDPSLLGDGSTYLDELRLYGTLTFADKTHAAGITPDDDRLHAEPLEATQIRDHLERLETREGNRRRGSLESRLNVVRSGIQEYVDGRTNDRDPVADFLSSESDIATLTLPTGYGKTLTGLLAAARIREDRGGDRIVYALPFTSVIDQTADVLGDLLREGPADTNPARDQRLTVHHHLSESLTLPRECDEDDPRESTDQESDQAVMLAESWRSGITLTTFVQLFESLAGPQNTQSMKLPSLYGSVVVIDEPQALPLTWWPLVERLIDALVDEYAATVILMTATQPRIIDDAGTFPLLDAGTLDVLEREAAGGIPERVKYEFHPTSLQTGTDQSTVVDYDDAATSLVSDMTDMSESVLAICNTIDSVGELFDAVRSELARNSESSTDTFDRGLVDIAVRFEDEIVDDDRFSVPPTDRPERRRATFVRSIVRDARPENPAVLFLSTRLRPCDRRFLLTVATELTSEPIPLLVVSTQLVEAGVDVSFDRVVRDFAPLDSIVQAAGRCNRSFERAPDAGTVTVWRLGAPGATEKLPCEAVYARRERDTDLDLLAKTREVLNDFPANEPIPDSEVAHTAVNEYHDAVGDAVCVVASDNDLYGQFQRAKGTDLRRASLIDTRFTFEVYVCRSNTEYELVEKYRKAERGYDFREVRRLKKKLADVRVSVPAYRRDSDTARKLLDLDPLSVDAEKGDATERVLRPDHHGSFFDTSTGVDVPESTVDTRIL